MNNPMSEEELLRVLENSDDDFGLSSDTDLGEGDSGDDADPEWSLPIVQTNNTEQYEVDNTSDVRTISTSGYTRSNRPPIVTHSVFKIQRIESFSTILILILRLVETVFSLPVLPAWFTRN